MESDMKTQLAKTSKMIKLQQTVERQLFSMLMNNTTNSDTHSHPWRYNFYWQKMEQIKNLFMICWANEAHVPRRQIYSHS